MVNVSVNDVVNVRASCLSLSMSACRQRWIFLRVSFVRCACADEWIDKYCMVVAESGYCMAL